MDFKPAYSQDSLASTLDPGSEPQTASSLGFDEKVALAPKRHWTTRPAKPSLLGLLPTAAVLLMIVGLITLMLRALLSSQCVETQKGLGLRAALRIGFFATIEGDAKVPDSKSHLWALTVSSLTNNLISNTSSVVMTLVAYRIGAEWLRLSAPQSQSRATETPNPTQYGLLVRLMGSSSLTSITETYVYIARSWNRAKLPRLFRHSVWLASAVWFLSRLLGLADVWLHSESYSFHNYLSVAAKGEPSMLGVAFNQSICPDFEAKYRNSQSLSTTDPSCQLIYEEFAAREHWGIDAGLDVMTRAAEALLVVRLLESGRAIVTPANRRFEYKNQTFTFPTFAAQATCTSINHLCEQDEEGATISCAAAGYPELPYVKGDGGEFSKTKRIKNRIFGVMGGRLLIQDYSKITSTFLTENPTTLAIQLQWEPTTQAAIDGASHVHSGAGKGAAAEMAIDHSPLPTLYATCSLTFLDAFVQWSGRAKTWSEVNATVASRELASALWLPVVWQRITEQVAADIMYTARRRAKEVTMVELGQDIAKLSLGGAAGFYQNAQESDVQDLSVVMVAIYPVVPVMVLLGLLFAYALLVLMLFLSSCWLPDESIVQPLGDSHPGNEIETSMLTLAQRWLTSPLPLVGFSFPRGDGLDGTRSASYFAMNTAPDGDEDHTRLAIGLNGERFGVTFWGQRRYYAEEA
ncbi:hypothetical protein FRC01_006578 [Tulasnella sp. 417]|nr:hypothetical protein FRC01_006578 [Tulasnella sp. 417]